MLGGHERGLPMARKTDADARTSPADAGRDFIGNMEEESHD